MPELMPITKTDFQALLGEHLSPGSMVRLDEPLARRTTLRVGGPADVYVEPASEKDLALVLRLARREGFPVMLLGRGSNLLIRDGGIRGVVISLAQPSFCEVRVEGMRLHCGAGVKLKKIAQIARDSGIGGLEFMEGIPGSLGGAMRMNAGAMGSATFDFVEEVRFMSLDGEVKSLPAGKVDAQYRQCALFRDHVALGALLEGRPASREEIGEKMGVYSQKRWNSQPAAPSAGCIFKNPLTTPSGKLIQELGLKGTRVGRAVVSDVHGNFIVNEGGATAREVLELIEVIKERARTLRGIELHTEVEIVGEDA
jgi:UDP-N-acetylenolpyruvoylglucosamine reductase